MKTFNIPHNRMEALDACRHLRNMIDSDTRTAFVYGPQLERAMTAYSVTNKELHADRGPRVTADWHKEALRKYGHTTPDVVEEYISKAEHGDGREYWTENFKTIQEVYDDFDLFVRARD